MHAPETSSRLSPTISSFIGRAAELHGLRRLLDSGARLITLTGPGGVGKTRLAQELAARIAADFTHGAFFVSLQALTDPEQVLPELATALDVRESVQRPLGEELAAALGDKHALLCVDNWEHVLAAAPQVAELLARCPRLVMVATSREALRVRGEHEFPVPPFHLPASDATSVAAIVQADAVQLFVARAQAARPGFQLDEANAGVIGEICVLLDGLPLAIELAAALIRLFSPQALLQRLKSSPDLAGRSPTLQLVVGGPRDLPVRQQTLRGAIAWSYDLLDPAEQRLFRWLAVFAGGCDLEAAEAVCDDGVAGSQPLLDSLLALVDKNLLRAEQVNGEPRFEMLRTIQEYALELLQFSGERLEAQRRHALCYLEMVERAVPELNGPAHAQWLERFDREHDNLRAALSWSLDHGQGEIAFRMAGELWRYWVVRGHSQEADRWLSRILAAPEDVPISLRAKVLNGAGAVTWTLGDLERARTFHTECLALRMHMEDGPGIAASYHNLAIAAHDQSDIETAEMYFRKSIAQYHDLGDRWGVADDLLQLGNIMRKRKMFDEARSHLERGRAILAELGDRQGVGGASYLLGELADDQGDYGQARRHFTDSKEIFVEFGDVWSIALAEHELGRIALDDNDLRQAETLLKASLRRKHDLGNKLGIAHSLEMLACLAAVRRDLERAGKLWGAAEALRLLIGAPLGEEAQASYERRMGLARTPAKQKSFLTAREAGARIGLDEAVRYALEPSGAEAKGTPARRSFPASLTAREVEVLALVAQGLTDAEVAERLVLSPRTVNAHLTSVYNKLGVNTRAAATRFAVEQKLV